MDDVIELFGIVDGLDVGGALFGLSERRVIVVDLLVGVHQILVVHVRTWV